jgi:hypothetical protein
MNVKEVVQRSIAYVADLFAQDGITNLGLEEVVYDTAAQEWIITVGFSRPWDYPKHSSMVNALVNTNMQPQRVYKILRMRDEGGDIVSVKNRT